jgi:hypothetical protein
MGGRAGGSGMGFGSRSGGGMSDAAIARMAASSQRFGLNDLNASIEPKLMSGEWTMKYTSFTKEGGTQILSVKHSGINQEVGEIVQSFPTRPAKSTPAAKQAYLKSYNQWVSKVNSAYDKAIAGYKSEIGKTKNKAAKHFFAKNIMQYQEWKVSLAKDAAWTNKVYSK